MLKDLGLLQLWHRLRMWLEFDLDPGTSVCRGCCKERKKRRKEKDKKKGKGEWNTEDMPVEAKENARESDLKHSRPPRG